MDKICHLSLCHERWLTGTEEQAESENAKETDTTTVVERSENHHGEENGNSLPPLLPEGLH